MPTTFTRPSSPDEIVGSDWEYDYDRWGPYLGEDTSDPKFLSNKVADHYPEGIGKPCGECAFYWQGFRKPCQN